VKLEPYVNLEDIMSTPLTDIISRVDKTPPKTWMQYQAILEYESQANKWPSKAESDEFVKIIQEWISKEYPSLKDLDTFSTDSLASLASTATAEVSPVCAVLGGVLGNEVIKAISGKGEPANNVLLLDGFDCKCRNVLVKPKTEN
jgi:ubiquitin-like 1-activating enzyme E1 A